MKKKIIIIIIVVLVIFTGYYLYLKNKNTITNPQTGEETSQVTFRDFFQFPPSSKIDIEEEPADEPVITGDVPIEEPQIQKMKLRKITDKKVAGYTIFQKEVTPAIYEDTIELIKGKKTTF